MTTTDHGGSGKVRIFLVEDSLIIRDNLAEVLHEIAPVEIVGSAADEASAVDWLRRERNACDLVMIDIFLKGGSGLGVLKALSRQPDEPKRIVFSNHATADIRAKCLELGASAVFDKSNELDEMLGWLTRFAKSDLGVPALHS